MTATSPSPSRSHHRLRPPPGTQSPYPTISTLSPEGQVDNEAAGLLHEFVHSHTHTPVNESPDPITYEIGGVEIDKVALEAQLRERAARPWWRRPSTTWFMVLSPLSMLAFSAMVAPRLQLYINLVCKDVDAGQWGPENGGAAPGTWSVGSTRPVPCAADPLVQAKVAKLFTIMATVPGLLSCLTAAFWGSFSDRYGRVLFLSLNTTTLLLADLVLVSLVVAPEHVPGGYWLLIYASAIEGLIGGGATATAAFHAYLADCSTPAARSQVFSKFLGIFYTGMALGPSLGGLAERLSGNPNLIFYIALGMHTINTLFLWFIIPESLLPAQMDFARRAKRAESRSHWSNWIFSFLSPLAVLAPVTHKESVTPQKALKKDWSLTWLALSLVPYSLVLGGGHYSLQYATGKFNWTGEIVGYYISITSIIRALFLAFGLPAILRFFASRRPVQLTTLPDEPLDARSSSLPSISSHDHIHAHTPTVDLGLAKFSLVLAAMCFSLIAVSKDSVIFISANALNALSAGHEPVMNSLSLELYTRRGGAAFEAGRLFGAMNVIQALGGQIVGPLLFGVVYIKTVATFPETLFYVLVIMVLLSLFFLFLVKIPSDPGAVDAAVEAQEAAGTVPAIVVDD